MLGEINPVASLIKLDLPEPFAPTNPVIPVRSVSVTWFSAKSGPYHFETRSKARIGGGKLYSIFVSPTRKRGDPIRYDSVPSLARRANKTMR